MKFQSSQLRAVSLAAARQDVRYYLCGVYLDPIGAMVATDGHRLHVARIDPFDGPGLILPIDTVDQIIKVARPGTKTAPEIRIDGGLTASVSGVSILFAPVDGAFPDWQRILPKNPSGKVAQFNPEYISDVARAEGYLTGGKTTEIFVHHNGDGAALVTSAAGEFFAIVMPYRSAPNTTATYWLLNPAETSSAA